MKKISKIFAKKIPCQDHKQNLKGTCVRCGLVLGLQFSTEPISRGGSFADLDKKTTAELAPTASPLRFADLGLGGTLPKFTPTNEAGVALRRVEKWRAGERWRERRLRRVLRELDKTAERLSLPRTVQGEVAYLYRKCQRKGLTQGHDTSATVGALVYIVCRCRHVARTLKEVKGSGDQATLNREVRRLIRELGLRLPIKSPSELAKEYLPRFATKLGLGEEAVKRGVAVLDNNGGHRGKSPAVLAGAVLWRVGGLPLAVMNKELGVGSANMSLTAKTLDFSPL